MVSDELVACWAALVAYVEDVHAPWDNLTKGQWDAADRLIKVLNRAEQSVEDYILFAALASSIGLVDPPDLSSEDWATAARMLVEYTAKVEA